MRDNEHKAPSTQHPRNSSGCRQYHDDGDGNAEITLLREGFPGGSAAKNLSANARDAGTIPVSGRSPRVGNGNSLWYSCLENSMDRRA